MEWEKHSQGHKDDDTVDEGCIGGEVVSGGGESYFQW